jgi:predicted transcriptional regulator
MNQYKFGYFPRNKYKDLVFYVKTGEHSNMGLFEMEDTEENRALMDALLSKSERDKVLSLIRCFIEHEGFNCGETDAIKEYMEELRQQAGGP